MLGAKIPRDIATMPPAHMPGSSAPGVTTLHTSRHNIISKKLGVDNAACEWETGGRTLSHLITRLTMRPYVTVVVLIYHHLPEKIDECVTANSNIEGTRI